MEFPEWDIKENWNVFRWLAVGGVPPSSPFVQQQTTTTHIVTTVLPIGNHPTHMICPRYVLLCYALLSPDALIRCVSLLLLFIFDVSDLCIFFFFNLFTPNSCHAEIQTRTRREPGLIAYVSGFIIALMGLVWHFLFSFSFFVKHQFHEH